MLGTLKFALMTCLVLGLLASSANATTLTESYTNTHLTSYGSDGSTVRTLSGSSVSTPDLDFESNGVITTDMQMLESGTSEIDQTIEFSAISYPTVQGDDFYFKSYSWLSTADSYISGTKVTNVDTTISTTGGITHASSDSTKVETTSYGMGMAAPQTDTYNLSVVGGQSTATNAALVSVPTWMTEDPKEFTLTFELDSLDLTETPADVFDQAVSLTSGVGSNDLVYYGYDFSRYIEVDDIKFKSQMAYGEYL